MIFEEEASFANNPYGLWIIEYQAKLSGVMNQSKDYFVDIHIQYDNGVYAPWGKNYIALQVDHFLMPVLKNHIATWDNLAVDKNDQAPENQRKWRLHIGFAFALAGLAVASPHALLALDRLQSHSRYELRAASTLALLTLDISLYDLKPDVPALMRAVEDNVFAELPLRCYLRLLPGLEQLFKTYRDFFKLFAGYFDSSRWGKERAFTTIVLLAKFGIGTNDDLQFLLEELEMAALERNIGKNEDSIFIRREPKARKAVAELIATNEESRQYLQEKIFVGWRRTPVIEVAAWLTVLEDAEVEQGERLLLLAQELFSILTHPIFQASLMRAIVRFANSPTYREPVQDYILKNLLEGDGDTKLGTLRGIWALEHPKVEIVERIVFLANANEEGLSVISLEAIETLIRWEGDSDRVRSIIEKATDYLRPWQATHLTNLIEECMTR